MGRSIERFNVNGATDLSIEGPLVTGSSGAGDNLGHILLPFVVLAVASWGVYSNIRRAAEKISTDVKKSNNGS